MGLAPKTIAGCWPVAGWLLSRIQFLKAAKEKLASEKPFALAHNLANMCLLDEQFEGLLNYQRKLAGALWSVDTGKLKKDSIDGLFNRPSIQGSFLVKETGHVTGGLAFNHTCLKPPPTFHQPPPPQPPPTVHPKVPLWTDAGLHPQGRGGCRACLARGLELGGWVAASASAGSEISDLGPGSEARGFLGLKDIFFWRNFFFFFSKVKALFVLFKPGVCLEVDWGQNPKPQTTSGRG